jgi:endonuclease/exonuclease/phosphatase family metal-dependent hydrolase
MTSVLGNRSLSLLWLALFFAVSLQPLISQARDFNCRALFTTERAVVSGKQGGARSLEEISKIRIMAYNVQDMFNFNAPRDSRPRNMRAKPLAAASGIAEAIRESDPDIVVMEEVEGPDTAADFVRMYLRGAYDVYFIEGNDGRQLDVGFLVKKDLNVSVVEETHKDETWNDPTSQNQEKLLFSRDLPALILRASGRNEPALIILGTHNKSKRNRGRDKESNILRAAQYKGAQRIIEGYHSQYGEDTPIILAGDFNTDTVNDPAIAPVKKVMTDAFDLLPQTPSDEERVTHTFHGGKNAPASKRQLDAIMVNPALASAVVSAKVYRYKYSNGQTKPLPESWNQRNENPSDHFPVVIEVSTEPMVDPR